ncbi:MAG: hypothetical protein AB7G93_14130 [Bdellovibrionales bacterium]
MRSFRFVLQAAYGFELSFLIGVLAFPTLPAQAQSDLIGVAGQYTQELGARGAVTNRRVADELYRRALQDEAEAWKSFPPNVSLLSRALTQSKEGKMADDQAKEFARAALHGNRTGHQAGELAQSKYGAVDESTLRSLATGSSPYMPAVESKLGSYGLKLSPDKMSLSTPFGSLAVNMDMHKYEGLLRKAAETFGVSPDKVSNGIRSAIQTRDNLARQFAAENSVPAGREGREGFATFASASDAESGSRGGAADASDSRFSPQGSGAHVEPDQEPQSEPPDDPLWEEKQKELETNRRQLASQLGIRDARDLDVTVKSPLGRPKQNIFGMIHMRYQSLRQRGVFEEDDHPPLEEDSISLVRRSDREGI